MNTETKLTHGQRLQRESDSIAYLRKMLGKSKCGSKRYEHLLTAVVALLTREKELQENVDRYGADSINYTRK